MRFILLFLLFSSLAWARFDRTFDTFKLSPSPDTISGQKFPRNYQPLYRGNPEVQFDKIRAVSAMLGGDEPVESILFSSIKLALMKEYSPFAGSVRVNMESRGFNNSIAAALLANNDKPYTLKEARKLAFKIMEADLWNRHKSGEFYNSYVDYKSYQLEIFPQDVIFSSTYLEVANIYSRFITVFDDSIATMLDLNYWNKVRHGDWTFTIKKWIDKGEFISPIAVESEKVQGFMEYLSQVPDHNVFRPLPNHLDLAFMRIYVGPVPHVLIFDGKKAAEQNAPAILKVNGQYYLADSQFDPDSDMPKNLKKRDTLAPLIAVVKLCPKDELCIAGTEVFKNYPISRRKLDQALLDNITSLEIRGKNPKIFFEPTKIEGNEKVTPPTVIKFLKSDELFSKLLKESSFQAKPFDAATIKNDLFLQWDFKGAKLAKGSAFYLKIPDEYRSKTLKSVTISQRQDPKDNSTPLSGNFDKSPAYTSVEFYALNEENVDPWRYWGGATKFNNPKGSFFGDLKTEAQLASQSLTDWSISKGHETNQSFTQLNKIGAIRVVGVGIDPATIHSLKVEFQ